MSKILVIGESGERPWYDGIGAKRLWSWFGAKSYAEMLSIADLMNVIPVKGSNVIDEHHLAKVVAAVESHELVYLIGKKAQVLITGNYDKRLMWHEGKFVGLPHPSGLNRQVNTLSKENIKALVQIGVRAKEGLLDA